MKITLDQMLLAILVDGVNGLLWQRSKDGAKNRNRPESLFKKLTEQDKSKDEYEASESIEDFERWYKATRT